MKKDSYPSATSPSFLGETVNLIGILKRRYELQQLIQWAKRKRLSRPRKLYQSRLQDEEFRLNRYLVCYPTMTTWTRRFYGLWRSLALKPRYYRRGYATKYRINSR